MAKNEEIAVFNIEEVDITSQMADLHEFRASGEILGLEAVTAEDLTMPKVRLLQSNSVEVTKGGMKAGQFYNTVDKTASDTLPCTLLSMGKSRVMWPDKFKRGDDPLCRSYDNEYSFDGEKTCVNCAYSDWDKAKAEGKNKPDCNMSYVWLGATTAGTPFRMTMGGMSVKPTKDFINKIAPKRLPAFAYKVVLSSTQEENENGIFYVVKYNIVGMVSREEFLNLQSQTQDLKATFVDAIKRDTLHNEDAIVEGSIGPNGSVF